MQSKKMFFLFLAAVVCGFTNISAMRKRATVRNFCKKRIGRRKVRLKRVVSASRYLSSSHTSADQGGFVPYYSQKDGFPYVDFSAKEAEPFEINEEKTSLTYVQGKPDREPSSERMILGFGKQEETTSSKSGKRSK